MVRAAHCGQGAFLEDSLERTLPASELAAAGLPVRAEAGRLPLREWLRFGGVELAHLAPWLDDAAFD